MVQRHEDYYAPIQRYNLDELEAVSATVQRVTQPDDVIVVIGCDWESKTAYYSHRRALSIPSWLHPSLAKVPGYLALPPPWRPGALVIKNPWEHHDPVEVQRVLRAAGYEVQYHKADALYDVYELRPRK
jgi:hypothetical protein